MNREIDPDHLELLIKCARKSRNAQIVNPSSDEIFACLDTLHLNRDIIDVDKIDGEFYWRCCKLDAFAVVRAFREAVTRFPIYQSERASQLDEVAYLRRCSDFAFSVLSLRMHVAESFPDGILFQLLANSPLSMRTEMAQTTIGGDERAYELRIFSGSITGEDVEREIMEMAVSDYEFEQHHPPYYRDPVADPRDWEDQATGPRRVTSNIAFEFVTEPDWYEKAAGSGTRIPFIRVTVAVPVPPTGHITNQFDHLVRNTWGWHTRLPGGPKKQEVDVALRTWAVGLLLATGARFIDAMREVGQFLSLPEVSQTRFSQDRQRLVERVPEARPYLYARDEATSRVAKG